MSQIITASAALFLEGARSAFIPAGDAGFTPSAYGTVISQPAARFTTGLEDGGPMASMTDKGGMAGNFGQATEDKQPLWKAAQINGLAAALFDGVDDTLASAGTVAHGIGAGDWWLGLVVNPASLSGILAVYVFGAEDCDIFFSGPNVRIIGMGIDKFLILPGLTVAAWNAIEIYVVSGVLHAACNGVVSADAGSPTAGIPNDTLNLAYPTGSMPFSGLMADALLLKSPTNLTALSAAWRKQFGL